MSKLQTLITTCGKPLLAIGLHGDDVRRAHAERRVAWIELDRRMGADRCRVVFDGTKAPDLVFDRPIPDELRVPIEDTSWVSPDDVLAALRVE